MMEGGRRIGKEERKSEEWKKKTVTIKRHLKPLFIGCSAVAFSSCF